jgi:plastocyanin
MKRFAILALALALAGCGSDENGAGESTSSALDVSETDFKLDPASLKVDAEGKVTIRATNDGEKDHALEIEGQGVEEETETIAPGESAEVTVELKSGSYEMYCPISNHRELGMEGTIVVAGGAGSASTGTGETETDDDDESGYGQG